MKEYKANWKYEMGQRIIDSKRDLTIIDRKIVKNKKGYNRKYYRYKCNKCGFDCGEYYDSKDGEYKNEKWIIEDGLYSGKSGCACCCGNSNIVVKGINDIATTNPELVKYFIDINDAYKYTYGSDKYVKLKCNICGFEKESKINDKHRNKFSCDRCSDGISYGEKIMFNLLYLFDVDFISQYSKFNSKWCQNYRYDFYFELNNEEFIIEINGLQHYEENKNFKKSLKNQQENDKNKYELAINNGIEPQNYIVIDCRYSELEFIKNNILHSRLNEIFDLNNINWIKICQDSEKSLVKEVCDYWHLHNEINNEGLTIKYLTKIFKLSNTTIRTYLKRGNVFDWCNYNPKEEIIKSSSLSGLKNSKQIEMFKDCVSLGIFNSASELERQSEKIFGVKLIQCHISEVAIGKKHKYKGFTFKYI